MAVVTVMEEEEELEEEEEERRICQYLYHFSLCDLPESSPWKFISYAVPVLGM